MSFLPRHNSSCDFRTPRRESKRSRSSSIAGERDGIPGGQPLTGLPLQQQTRDPNFNNYQEEEEGKRRRRTRDGSFSSLSTHQNIRPLSSPSKYHQSTTTVVGPSSSPVPPHNSCLQRFTTPTDGREGFLHSLLSRQSSYPRSYPSQPLSRTDASPLSPLAAPGAVRARPIPSQTKAPTATTTTLIPSSLEQQQTSSSALSTTSTPSMTRLEWVRCCCRPSGAKVCIFLVLGIIHLMLGIFIGAFYLNIQQLTTSSVLTEVLPNYVIALSVMLIGFSVMVLFWMRSRVLLFISMVLNVCGFLLCVLTTILTGTHILKPIVSINYCEYRVASKLCLCYSPYKRSYLTMEHSENKLFTLPFYGSSNCELKILLPKMLYVLCTITFIAALVCAISYIITLRVYRMKKNKEEELENEVYDPEVLHHINRDDSYLSSRCHDSPYSGIPPSPESPVPLLEAVSSRGISILDKASILKDLWPDLGKRRHVKRSQSFSYHERSIEGTCNSLDDNDAKILDKTHPRYSKGRNVPCRTLSETVRPSSAGTPDNSMRKLSKQEGDEDNLDNRQLLLILGLHMRNIQEQHKAEIQTIQQENIRRAKTPQPYYPVGKDGYMVGRRAYTPQPAKSQFPTPKGNEGHYQVQPPRRRQLFADQQDQPASSGKAKVFAEAMMNDMVCQGRLTPQEHFELEPLPFCTLDGMSDMEVAQKMSKMNPSDTYYMPQPSMPQPNVLKTAMVDSKKIYTMGRTLSNSIPSKNDSVFVVPLYEKIDTPEHDILQSSLHEPIIGANVIPERVYQRTPSPFGIKPSSSKVTKPGDELYGKINKHSDQHSPAMIGHLHNYSYLCQIPKRDTLAAEEAHLQPRHYVKPTEDRIQFSPHRHKYLVKEPPQDKSTPYERPQPDMLDLSVTPESLNSDFSPGDDRGNISGTSVEFSPPAGNANRSNASGTSIDLSPNSAFQDVRKLCDTPIAHPKMLLSTPNDSPSSPNENAQRPPSINRCAKTLVTSIVYSPEEGHRDYFSTTQPDFSRNISGESSKFSPIETHPSYSSPNRMYSPSRHVVEVDKSLSPSINIRDPNSRGNITGASVKMSPCRNSPQAPSNQVQTPKMNPSVKKALLSNRVASEPPKRNTKPNRREEYNSSVRGRSASLSPHRNTADDSLGPREQPYGQHGPYNRKIEGCNVYVSPSKKEPDSRVQSYKNQKWNPDTESQPRKEKPPPPYTSRNTTSSKSGGEARKNPCRARGNFRVGPEGVSYRRKKVERLDMSFDQVDDLPRSELDVEGDVDREELYPTLEHKQILTNYEYQKRFESPQNILLLRNKGSGSDSDALETVI